MFARAEAALKGWPDEVLSVALIATAIVLTLIALFGPSLLKAAALGWVLFP